MSLHKHIYKKHACILFFSPSLHIYIYIYIYRESERMHACVYVCVRICIYAGPWQQQFLFHFSNISLLLVKQPWLIIFCQYLASSSKLINSHPFLIALYFMTNHLKNGRILQLLPIIILSSPHTYLRYKYSGRKPWYCLLTCVYLRGRQLPGYNHFIRLV